MIDPLEPFRLDGRVAVVTGASSGLGARFARVLSAVGASTMLAARRADRLNALVDELGPKAAAHACDLSQMEDIESLVDATMARFGRIDVLVNNAGATHVSPALDEADEDFERIVRLDLVSPFVLARRSAAVMAEQAEGGSIVNVASILGLVGIGRIPQAGYCAAKGGLVNMSRELAAQWGRMGVRVNSLAPGWFPSEITEEMLEDERSVDFLRRHTPMDRVGREHELDGALLYLASSASSYVTGHVLVVDGGWTVV